MYIINKIVEDYEGTWSNVLMYETDFSKAIEIANTLQESIISLKTKYLDINKIVQKELKKSFPFYGDFSIDFNEQLKNIVLDDNENYFDKEERLLKEITDIQLTDTEKLLYNVTYMKALCKLIYFNIQKTTNVSNILEKSKSDNNSFNIEYSTKEKSQEHSEIFEKFLNEY